MPNRLQNYVNILSFLFFFFFFFFCSLAFIGNRYCFWGSSEGKRKKVKHKNRREITNKTQTLRTLITSRQTMWIQRKEIMWHAARALSSLDLWLLCQQFDFPPTSPPPCRLWHLFFPSACRTDCSHVLTEGCAPNWPACSKMLSVSCKPLIGENNRH